MGCDGCGGARPAHARIWSACSAARVAYAEMDATERPGGRGLLNRKQTSRHEATRCTRAVVNSGAAAVLCGAAAGATTAAHGMHAPAAAPHSIAVCICTSTDMIHRGRQAERGQKCHALSTYATNVLCCASPRARAAQRSRALFSAVHLSLTSCTHLPLHCTTPDALAELLHCTVNFG